MNYTDFCNTVINALNTNEFDKEEGRCLNDIRIQMQHKSGSELEECEYRSHNELCAEFHSTYPKFNDDYFIEGFNDGDISLHSISLYFLETKIKEFRFYGLAMSSGSGRNLMLPILTPVSQLEKAICTYHTGEMNVDRLANNLVCVAL